MGSFELIAVAAGPYVRYQKVKLAANTGKPVPLADIHAGEWCRVAIIATTASGKYDISLTRQSGVKKEFKDIPCNPTWNTANYLLFSSLADKKTAYFIDNVKLEQITKPK